MYLEFSPVLQHPLKNIEDLNWFKDRVHFALESSLKTSMGDDIAKKVAAKLLGKRSWQSAAQQVLDHSPCLDPAPAQFLSPSKAIYNWFRFIMRNDDEFRYEAKILAYLRCALGPCQSRTLGIEHIAGAARLDLLERLSPQKANLVVDQICLSDTAREALTVEKHCPHCGDAATPFSRCANVQCKHHLLVVDTEGESLRHFDAYGVEIHTAEGTILVNTAPMIEYLIIRTTMLDLAPNQYSKDHILNPSFHPLTSWFYGLTTPILSVTTDREKFWSWLRHQRVQSANLYRA